MRYRKTNAFLFIIGDLLTFLEKRLGIFGRFSLELLAGLLLALGSLFLFAKLTEDLLFNELLAFDSIGTLIIRSFSSDTVTSVMKFASDLGSTLFLALVGVGMMVYLGLFRKHFWDTMLVPLALFGGGVLNTVLKYLFQRQRPILPHLVEVTGFSFPSGHAMLSFIFYGLVAYLILLNTDNRLFKKFTVLLAVLIILAVGISRVYLGVHYPSDVLAGFAAGSFWLIACILGLRGIRHYKSEQRKRVL